MKCVTWYAFSKHVKRISLQKIKATQQPLGSLFWIFFGANQRGKIYSILEIMLRNKARLKSLNMAVFVLRAVVFSRRCFPTSSLMRNSKKLQSKLSRAFLCHLYFKKFHNFSEFARNRWQKKNLSLLSKQWRNGQSPDLDKTNPRRERGTKFKLAQAKISMLRKATLL